MTSQSAKNKGELPAHHEANGKGFVNPWPSFHNHSFIAALKMMIEFDRKRSKVTADTKLPKVQDLDMSLIDSLSLPKQGAEDGARHGKVSTTWLGQYVAPLLSINPLSLARDDKTGVRPEITFSLLYHLQCLFPSAG